MKELRDFDRKIEHIEKSMKLYPKKAGVLAVNFTKERFRAGNWLDKRTESWRGRQLNPNGRGALIGKGSGALKRSIRITSVTSNSVVIGTDKDYAQAHNEGMRIAITDRMRKFFWARHIDTKEKGKMKEAEYWLNLAVTKKSHITIPKRQFMGESQVLITTIERHLLADMNKAVKS